MREKYDSFPYYKDIIFCQKCGKPLEDEQQLVNLITQPNYERAVKGNCKKCGFSYNLISKFFKGADNEKYHGHFEATGHTTTISGSLTTNGIWDKNKIIKENKAKNFRLLEDIKKEKQRQATNYIIHRKY